MDAWVRKLTVLVFVLSVIVAVGVCNSQAAGFGRGHKEFGAYMKLISSLNLNSAQKANLTAALTNYGPAVKTAWKALRVAEKTLRTDLKATPPDGSTLVTDATNVANAKAQLKSARATLDTALETAIGSSNVSALETALETQFASRVQAKADHILFGYARYLEKQQ